MVRRHGLRRLVHRDRRGVAAAVLARGSAQTLGQPLWFQARSHNRRNRLLEHVALRVRLDPRLLPAYRDQEPWGLGVSPVHDVRVPRYAQSDASVPVRVVAVAARLAADRILLERFADGAERE